MKIGRSKRTFKVEPLTNPVPRKEQVPPPRQPETPQPARVRTTAQA